jgi:hypothetical protein
MFTDLRVFALEALRVRRHLRRAAVAVLHVRLHRKAHVLAQAAELERSSSAERFVPEVAPLAVPADLHAESARAGWALHYVRAVGSALRYGPVADSVVSLCALVEVSASKESCASVPAGSQNFAPAHWHCLLARG